MIWSLLCWQDDSSSVQDDSLSQQCAIPDALLYPSAKLPWSSTRCRLSPTLTLAHSGARWTHPRDQRHGFHPTGVRTCKAVSKCAERIPRIPLLGPGGLVWCWVPGREGRGARGIGSRLSSWHLLWSLSLPTAINQTVWLFSMVAT